MRQELSIEELEQLPELTKLQAAKFVGISDRAIANHAASGKLSVRYDEKGRGLYNIEQLKTLKAEAAERQSIRVKRQGGTSEVIEGEAVNPEGMKTESSSSNSLAVRRNVGTPATRNHEGVNGGNITLSGVDLAALVNQAALNIVAQQGEPKQVTTMQELAVKPLLTFAEAAQLTGLSERSLRVDAKDGKLKAVRQGRADRISRKNLDKYLEEIHG